MTKERLITVFGSHTPKPGHSEYELAEQLGSLLAGEGFAVASGGYGGTMEAVLKGAGVTGREGIGYTVDVFPAEPNRFVIKEVRTGTIYDRLDRMINDSHGLIALRGGTGTLLELAACWEMVSKKMVPYKPIVCIGEYWHPVVDILASELSIENISTLRPDGRLTTEFIHFATDPLDAVNILIKELNFSGD